MRLLGKLLLLLLAVGAVSYWYLTRPALGQVLVFSKTAEYRHESIAAGIAALTEIASEHRIEVVATEDPARINTQELPSYRAVVFLNTTGMVLASEQQEALQRYIQAGGGFVGIHAAADTHWKENDWPWYTRLLGAAFASHPSTPSNVQPGRISVPEPDNLLTSMFAAEFEFSDEWYDYQRISPAIKVLLRVDEDSYQGGQMGEDHPLAWYQDFDGGRSFYTNFGHRPETFSDPSVREHLWAGLRYAMGSAELDFSKASPESWRLKRVILDAGLDEPMAMDFTPQGDIYYVQRKGELMRYDPERQESVEIARFAVHDAGEYGLLGMAFDPDFATNNWVYIFRNVLAGGGARYQLSRYKLVAEELDYASEQVILQIPTEQGRQNHTGGALVFGPHGNLWISTGDTTNPHESNGFSPHDDRPGRAVFDAARSAGNSMDLRGKILRIKVEANGSYSIPEGNLFAEGENGRREIFVMGVRNPFRFSVDQRTGTLYWGEVGPDSRDYSDTRGPWGYDEFNRTDQPGNFGWPFVIADNEPYAYFNFETGSPGEFVNPAAPENHSANNTGASILPPARPAWMPYPYTLSDKWIELGEGGRSAMAGQVYYFEDYPANPVKLPPYYDGKLFIFEWVRHWVQAVSMADTGEVVKIEPVLEAGLYSAPIDLKFAPDGSLYVLEYGSAWFSQNDDAFLTRIEYYGDANPPPQVVATADQRVGAAPLTTWLRGSQSFDRNGEFESLGFSWDLVKNGRVLQHIAATADTQFTAEAAGDYQLRLTVTDADGVSSEAGVLLEAGNDVPRIEIGFANGNGSVFWDGAAVDYSVVVTDSEDGSSNDGGIDPARVRISLQYVPQGEDLANAVLGHQASAGGDGWSEIEASDCLSCHALEKASVGPSFTAVAERYAGQQGIVAELTDKILQGSHGNWGDYSMPPHPQLTPAQAATMAGWIVDPGTQAAVAPGLPIQGTISFDRHQADHQQSDMMGRLYSGRYMLLVSYQDRGAAGAHPQTAELSRVWLPPVIDPSAVHQMSAVMTMPVPLEGMQGSVVAIYRSGAGQPAWVMLNDMDLTGIARVKVGVTTTSMFTRGGELSLRLDSADGELMGSYTVENQNIGMPDTLDYYEFDVSGVAGSRALYLTTEDTESESRKPDYILGTIEFIR